MLAEQWYAAHQLLCGATGNCGVSKLWQQADLDFKFRYKLNIKITRAVQSVQAVQCFCVIMCSPKRIMVKIDVLNFIAIFQCIKVQWEKEKTSDI